MKKKPGILGYGWRFGVILIGTVLVRFLIFGKLDKDMDLLWIGIGSYFLALVLWIMARDND